MRESVRKIVPKKLTRLHSSLVPRSGRLCVPCPEIQCTESLAPHCSPCGVVQSSLRFQTGVDLRPQRAKSATEVERGGEGLTARKGARVDVCGCRGAKGPVELFRANQAGGAEAVAD